MVKAYILVQTSVGRAFEVSELIAPLEGVVEVDDVTGPYDIIVTVETDDVQALGRLVQEQIQAVEGITRTVTCPVVRS